MDEQAKRLEFSNHFRIETEGLSGGIWLFWQADMVQINIVFERFQCLHTRLTFKDSCKWSFSVIYASLNDQQRPFIWQELNLIRSRTSLLGFLPMILIP